MNNTQIWPVLRQKSGVIILAGVLVAALSFAGMIILEKSFKSQTDFIVIQNQKANLDYYALSKSAEYLGKVLSESIYSEAFIEEIVKSGKIEDEFLPFDKKKRLEEWNRIVRVNRKSDLGIIEIVIFADEQKSALRISQGISFVMAEKSALFLGENSGATVRTLSGPIVEKNPGVKNLLAAIVGGFVFGALISSLAMVLRKKQEDLLWADFENGQVITGELPTLEEYEELNRQ